MKRFILTAISGLYLSIAFAQTTNPLKSNGERESQVYYAFTNAVIYTHPDKSFKGTLLIRDGRVVKSGGDVNLPAGTVVRDMKGAFIYPAFIDALSTAGSPEIKPVHKSGPVYERKNEKGFYWNQAVHPETRASDLIKTDDTAFTILRANGVAITHTHVPDGVIRGTGMIAFTGGEDEREKILKANSGLVYSFEKGSSPQDYPSSQMGSIALLRQFFYDANWYNSTNKKKDYNLSLEIFPSLDSLPRFFSVKDKQEILRAMQIANEFDKEFIYRGTGDEYQRADVFASQKTKLIIPITLPGPAEVSDPFNAGLVNLSQMKHWELAPHNARILTEKKVPFSFTFEGIKNPEELQKNVAKMIDAGLPFKSALCAMTQTPAEFLGIENEAGTLEDGKLANFIITSDSLFKKGSQILETWVNGYRHIHKPVEMADIRGNYDLNIGGDKIYTLIVSGDRFSPKAKAALKGSKDTIEILLDAGADLLTLNLQPDKKLSKDSLPQWMRLSGKVNYKSGIWDGKGQDARGNWINWSAIKKGDYKQPADTTKKHNFPPGEVLYPFNGFGFSDLPDTSIILIRNATVWTNEAEGILTSTDVLLKDGKIAEIGKGIDISKIRTAVTIIDATGKHLTPGIIDEHSHIAISKGVNEGTQAVTSEVRISDVINAEDINIYRQLAGGVTTSQLLHGSANPIGGQSGLIKLRWGRTAEEMKFDASPGYIKFALGENVKQSNWGPMHNIRFPQTRMGVEQVFYDAFQRTKEYMAEWEAYNLLTPKERNKKKVSAPRVDLELEALAEIMRKERFITCHSYVQSEINMLMHVADSMGFKINTFTHILEGYKVADKMKEHGAAAATFSDWWAYKFEVNDAIPYNAALLNEMGVLTAINSDDAEMGRRLNHEAAKTMKYGGVSEEDALKMITLNPAKMLHVDDRTGSIKTGKDADLVLWSDHPLSVYSKALKTIVDGVVYYDRAEEEKKRIAIENERIRLINLMLEAKKRGEKTESPKPEKSRQYHCDTLEE